MQESLDSFNVLLTQLQCPPPQKKKISKTHLHYTNFCQESERSLHELWQYMSLQANFKDIQDSQRSSFSVVQMKPHG